jgi:carboxylesterase
MEKKMKKSFFIIIIFILLFGCAKYEYEGTWMDSANVKDASLNNSLSLVSNRPIEDPLMLEIPVIICAHGYSASTYEWEEFADYAEGTGNVLVSNVLLGGHGRSVEEFKETTWEDWQQPIIDEYKALSELGYKNINLAGSSGGGALILEILLSNKLAELTVPNNIFLIDPYVIPVDTSIGFIGLIGIFVKNFPNDDLSEKEKEHWYYNRPVETIIELNELISAVKSEIENGYELPQNTWLTTYKIINDVASDPECIILFADGITATGTGKIEAHLYDSDNHVFTRGNLRDVWTDFDKTLQMQTFNDIVVKSMH